MNGSLTKGKFPDALKRATVVPIIKSLDEDPENLKNYRPVSNTPILAKIIEKAALEQITSYLTLNNLQSNSQSAYKKGHSCETAMLKVVNDIQEEINKNNMIILLMLDLSAAFDTIDQDILLAKLERYFGIYDKVLAFLKSFLKERTYSVTIGDLKSSKKLLSTTRINHCPLIICLVRSRSGSCRGSLWTQASCIC